MNNLKSMHVLCFPNFLFRQAFPLLDLLPQLLLLKEVHEGNGWPFPQLAYSLWWKSGLPGKPFELLAKGDDRSPADRKYPPGTIFKSQKKYFSWLFQALKSIRRPAGKSKASLMLPMDQVASLESLKYMLKKKFLLFLKFMKRECKKLCLVPFAEGRKAMWFRKSGAG